MSALACGRILRWTWKMGLVKCVAVQESSRLSIPYRSLSSSSQQSIQNHERKLTKQSLADMGFSESQAEVVYEGATKHRCKGDLPVLMALFSLGLNAGSVLKILEKCPALYSVTTAQLQQRITNLRKLGLLEGSLQRVISHHPQILTLQAKRVNAVSRRLREKCKFTAQQVTDILRDSPHVTEEEPACLEYMFQYVYFRMGCRQAEMVKAKLFRLSAEELRCRHGFLERRGLYQTPDKKGQTLILNPRLKDVLSVSEDVYLGKIANATQEEFDVFRKLVAREQEELDEGDEYSSEDEGEEEEEDEEIEDHTDKPV
ncbi:transcription termination factor 4, mitochondrial [Trichomycterus rosablanca]|uniref:transcription termination factor 4, mitochondrial n=1 Tax=Trichomycterus rosablanca TaxID=2290929 RepID=UPI002F358F35